MVKKRTLSIMATSFKNFKVDLNKNVVEEGIEPDWEKEFHTQKEYWQEFIKYKLSQQALEVSARAQACSKKNNSCSPPWLAWLQEERRRMGKARGRVNQPRCHA